MNKKLNIRINSNSLALLILLGSIAGFPLVAAVAELASIKQYYDLYIRKSIYSSYINYFFAKIF